MIYKSYILEQKINTILNYKMFLLYGENQGLKKDFKEKIQIENKNIKVLRLFQEEIIKNKNLLTNEILNKSLFDEKKIIFIEQANDKILEVLDEIIENIEEEKIFIFAELLDKKSKLRAYFEKSKSCGVVACYVDNEITIRNIITNSLNRYKGLTPQIINLIIQNTGLDRNKVNNEIEKIQSCFQDKIIDADKINLLLNIRTNEDFNQLKDAALNGNKKETNRLLTDTVFETENNIFYLNSINQRMNKLKEIENLKQKDTNIEILVANIKPPIFWKDKPILINQSKKWNKNKIQQALKKTYNAEIELKSNATIRKDLIIKNLIVDLCSEANAF